MSLSNRARISAFRCCVVTAFVGVRPIEIGFMELRSAPRPLRTAFEFRRLAVCSALLALYWLSAAGL